VADDAEIVADQEDREVKPLLDVHQQVDGSKNLAMGAVF